ncbi:MAG: ferredoxin family protein [candidate division WOR-3 bacterium]
MPWLIGYPRDKVEWYPTVDAEKCVQCGMCMNCGKGVFDWTEDGPVVARPYECVVGCTTCANLCQGNAIKFPQVKELRKLYAREKIWDKVKEALEADGKLTPLNKKEKPVGGTS